MRRFSFLLAMIMTLSAPGAVFAQSSAGTSASTAAAIAGDTIFVLRPHCEKEKQEECPSFEVNDPESLRTPLLKTGDTLDIDVVLQNPGKKSIRRLRTWLSYDSSTLEGVSITPGKALPIVVPGEADFAPSQGYVKIGMAAEEGKEPTDAVIIAARVQMKIKSAPQNGRTPISFYDQRPGSQGHAFALAAGEGDDKNLVEKPLGSLVVQVDVPAASQTSSAAASATTSAATSTNGSTTSSNGTTSSAAPAQAASFTFLQVQNVRVTTEDSSLYIAWDELKTPRLQGYNVYYGTQMGRYIQRRGLPATATSITIRDLPKGTTYYIAVRAVNEQNEESAFSQEAGVQIGNPSTSTAPLLSIPAQNAQNAQVTPQNPLPPANSPNAIKVPGESGLPSGLTLMLIACGVIGLLFAFRRQWIAVAPSRPQ